MPVKCASSYNYKRYREPKNPLPITKDVKFCIKLAKIGCTRDSWISLYGLANRLACARDNLYRIVKRNTPPTTCLIVICFDENWLLTRCLYVFQRSSILTSSFLVIPSSSLLWVIPHKIQLKST